MQVRREIFERQEGAEAEGTTDTETQTLDTDCRTTDDREGIDTNAYLAARVKRRKEADEATRALFDRKAPVEQHLVHCLFDDQSSAVCVLRNETENNEQDLS